MEVWGGATFDVSMRFLNESPWKRLQAFREAMPNMLLQMLFRGSNAVGYSAYPDNLIEKFVEKSAENGIDVFRIFDSLNWVEAMKVSIRAVRERTNSIAEASICYTGDIFNNEKIYTSVLLRHGSSVGRRRCSHALYQRYGWFVKTIPSSNFGYRVEKGAFYSCTLAYTRHSIYSSGYVLESY
jgi:hypothetical protein